MINKFVRYSLLLFVLMLFQLAIFDNIIIWKGIVVYIYIYFFLKINSNIKPVLLLLIGFVVGVFFDSFFNTGGIHAFACVFISFIRPFLLKMFISNHEIDLNFEPGIISLGFSNFIKFSFFIVFFHSLLIYFLELFHFKDFFFNFFIVLLNTTITVFFCALIEILLKKEK